MKVVYNFGLLILFLVVAITWYLFIELRGWTGVLLGDFFGGVCFSGGHLVLGHLIVIKWLCHVTEKYGSLIEEAMAGANMRTEVNIIEEVELLLCPTWVGGEGLGGHGDSSFLAFPL